jgi:Recombinase
VGVEFVAVDNPHGQQTDHPHPGGRCRTRARGDLGAHQGDPGGRQGAGKAAGHAPDPAGAVERMRVARKAQAARFAANVLPIIRDIQAAGHTSLNAIVGQLNTRKVATANGGQWRHVQVRQILDRADTRWMVSKPVTSRSATSHRLA